MNYTVEDYGQGEKEALEMFGSRNCAFVVCASVFGK